MSKIEWTEKVWNPLTGCTRVSEGCENCYAEKMAFRLMHMGQEKYKGVVHKTPGGKIQWTGKINLDESALTIPLKTKKPTVFFVNSMSDLFHKDVPFYFIDKVFAVMSLCPHHTFQVLTKRVDIMLRYFTGEKGFSTTQRVQGICLDYLKDGKMKFFGFGPNDWSEYKLYSDKLQSFPLKNVWIGASVENQKAADERIPLLLQVPAAIRWLSCEPLLGPVDLMSIVFDWKNSGRKYAASITNKQIQWVVAGGESGTNARPMHPFWARLLRDQCESANIPFFFKQWGEWEPKYYFNSETGNRVFQICTDDKKQCLVGSMKEGDAVNMYKVGKKAAGSLLDGKEYKNYPQNSK